MMLLLVVLMQVSAPPRCAEPYPLREGDVAPCDGSLYTLELRQGMVKEKRALKAELAGALKIAEIYQQAGADNAILFSRTLADRAAEFAVSQAQCVAKVAAAPSPKPVPFLERPSVVWPVAILTTAGLIFGGAWALEKVRRE